MSEFEQVGNLIKAINPDMPAEQVIANLRLANEIYHGISHGSQSPVDAARAELLRRSGFEPPDWTWYSNYLPHSGEPEPTDQDLADLRKPFPADIELLIIQGAFLGGTHGTRGHGTWSWVKYSYNANDWSVFVRVKKQLPNPNQNTGGRLF